MIESEKQRLRERMRKLGEAPPEGKMLCLQHLLGIDLWKRSSSILLYAPLFGEPDPTPLIDKTGRRSFFFPKVSGNSLEIYRMTSRSNWIRGAFGIREPDPESWEKSSPEEIDLAVIPGLAFDSGGGRLGRGMGYYDRLLGNPAFRGIKLGIAWEWQIVEKVPSEAHDIRMDLILAGEKMIDPGSMLDKPEERG
jgi:5-formyltetrahydrofolate cyclo-ligase